MEMVADRSNMVKIFRFLFVCAVLLAIAGCGFVGITLWYFGRDLPDYQQLAHYQPSIMTRVQAGDGRLLAEYAAERRIFVPIQAIPKPVQADSEVHYTLVSKSPCVPGGLGVDCTVQVVPVSRSASVPAFVPPTAMHAVTDGLARLFGAPAPWLRSARNLGLAGLDRLPTAKRLLAQAALR